MPSYGYDQGNPFGDPNKFTRSTGEDEVNRFNSWMRSQPWWQQIRGSGTGDVTPAQEQQIAQAAQAQGITVPHDFHIDQGGNFNQKSRTKRNLIIAGLAGAAALSGGAALGAFGGMGAAGAGGAAAGGAGAAGAAGAGTLASTAIGSGFIPAIAGGTGLGALGGGAAAAGIGGGLASTALGSGMAAPIAGGTGISSAAGGGGVLSTLGTIGRNGQRLTDLGNTLSQGAGAMAGGRREDSNADMYAANANNRARLDAANFNAAIPGVRTTQVARGDLLANMHDAAPTGDPRIDKFGGGGLRPSAFGPDTTQAGNELKRQALMALMTKSDQLDPQITQPRKAGLGENLMAGAGMTSNILGTLGRFGGR